MSDFTDGDRAPSSPRPAATSRDTPALATMMPAGPEDVVFQAPTSPSPAPPPSPARLVPGGHLGRWILDRKLGDGATAVVWAAHHSQLGSPVAIKIFHQKDMPFRAVLGEARAAAGIPSPFVVWVHDVDVLDGHPSMVMQLVGTTEHLAITLHDNAHPLLRDAVRWIADAARGVAAAHEVGVFHKDIKPANILIHPLDNRACITDFGLANPHLFQKMPPDTVRQRHSTVHLEADKAAARVQSDDPCREIRGSLRLGTPEFMAPEQAAGLRRDLDPENPTHRFFLTAIDVYGLGATLYTLLAGRPPFPLNGADPDGLDALTIIEEAAKQRPHPLRTVAPRIPARLERIVARAMAKNPQDRYHSALALAQDLEAWLDGRSTSVDVHWWTRAAVTFHRERARILVTTAFLSLLAASSTIVYLNDARLREQEAELADNKAILSQMDADLASARTDVGETREQLQNSEQRSARLRKALADRERQNEALFAQNGQVQDERNAVALELAARDAKLQETRESFSTLTQEVQMLDQQLFETRKDIGEYEQQIAGLQGDLSTSKQRNDALDAQLTRLARDSEAKLAEHKATIDRLNQQLRSLQAQNDKLTAQRNDLIERLRRLEHSTAPVPTPPPPTRDVSTTTTTLALPATSRPPPVPNLPGTR